MRSVTYKQKQTSSFNKITESSQEASEKISKGQKRKVILRNQQEFFIEMHMFEDSKKDKEKQCSIFGVPAASRQVVTGKEIKLQMTQKSFSDNHKNHNELYRLGCKARSLSQNQTFEQNEIDTTNTFYITKKKKTSHQREVKRDQLLELRKKNERNLIGNIVGLRQREKNFVSVQNQKDSEKTNLTKYLTSKKEDQKKSRKEQLQEKIKEERLTMKQKMKIKQSRRHIYHTLQHQSEILRKLLPKYRNKSLITQKNSAFQNEEREKESNNAQDYHINLCHLEKIPLSNLKYSDFLHERGLDLKVESRQAYFEYEKHLKEIVSSTLRNTLSKRFKISKIFNTMNDFKNEKNLLKDLSFVEMPQDDEEGIKNRGCISTEPQKQEVKDGFNSIFRGLTPWHTSDED